MTNESEVVQDLVREYHRSVEKYSDWSEYTFWEMIDKLTDELLELKIALYRGDLAGPHGAYSEAVQVANCATKIAIQAQKRNDAGVPC